MPSKTILQGIHMCFHVLQETARANGGRTDAFHEAIHEVEHLSFLLALSTLGPSHLHAVRPDMQMWA